MKPLRSIIFSGLACFLAINGANAAGVTVMNESLTSGDNKFYFVELQTYVDGAPQGTLKKYQIVVPAKGESSSGGYGSMPDNLGFIRLYKAEGNSSDLSALERGKRVALCHKPAAGGMALGQDTSMTITVKQTGSNISCEMK
jgi:hypothetical protein